MSHDCEITQNLKRAQVTMFEQAGKIGLTHKIIHYDSGISLSAIGQYARGETALSVTALIKLIGVIPENLLSLLLPTGRQIVRAPDELDHDALCELAADYVETKARSHRRDSPDGVDLSDCEREKLAVKAAELKAVA